MRNDYDTLAEQMREALKEFSGNYHEPLEGSDSVTITKDGLLRGINKLQRTIDWCQGLADSHRLYSAQHSVQRMGLLARLFKWLAQVAHR